MGYMKHCTYPGDSGRGKANRKCDDNNNKTQWRRARYWGLAHGGPVDRHYTIVTLYETLLC